MDEDNQADTQLKKKKKKQVDCVRKMHKNNPTIGTERTREKENSNMKIIFPW